MYRKIAFSNRCIRVSFVWVIGLVLGMAFAYSSKALIAPMLRGDIFMPASFTGILVSAFLPICLTLLAAWFRLGFLLYVLLFSKAFIHGFASLSLFFGSSSGGWMVCSLQLFSQSSCCFIFILLSLILLHSQKYSYKKLCVVFLSAAAFLCLMDHFFISKLYLII